MDRVHVSIIEGYELAHCFNEFAMVCYQYIIGMLRQSYGQHNKRYK